MLPAAPGPNLDEELLARLCHIVELVGGDLRP
jgi:hypothetical protein